jgi:hypothetical protein
MKQQNNNKVEIEVEKFKKLIKEMYRGFPNWQFRKMVEEVIVTEDMRKSLLDSKFLLKETHVAEGKEYDVYTLGVNALPLVSAWETEELTKSIRKLTWAVLIMTGISLLLLVAQTLNIFGVLG